MKTVVLLINLGTPSDLSLKSMKAYLSEFLMDKRVLNIPFILRWILVNLIIVPSRAKKNVGNYKKIWTKEGSPLMVYSKKLKEGLEQTLGNSCTVEIAMRYQNPGIKVQVDRLVSQGFQRIIAVPLYPQYASATTGSVVESLMDALRTKWHIPSVEVMPFFYDEKLYLDAVCQVSKPHLNEAFDHYVFSYHGLPVKHLQIGETGSRHCKAKGKCCDKITDANSFCYRAQCFATTRELIKKLKLDEKKTTTCFQSRFGKDPWIQPFTNEVIENLAAKKVKKIAVFCPAFVADCIETLEEIAIGEKENFIAKGGENLTMIPCLNDSPFWIQNLAKLLKQHYQL